MKFDEYPKSPDGIIEYNGSELIHTDRPQKCVTCGSFTSWLDTNLYAYTCSETCNDAEWAEVESFLLDAVDFAKEDDDLTDF